MRNEFLLFKTPACDCLLEWPELAETNALLYTEPFMFTASHFP